MADLNELLAKWAELEPERCKQVRSAPHWCWNVSVAGQWTLVYPDLLRFEDFSRLEYALREAIEARGWEWCVDTTKANNPPCTGIVYFTSGIPEVVAHGAIPAIALLTAYLKALETAS